MYPLEDKDFFGNDIHLVRGCLCWKSETFRERFQIVTGLVHSNKSVYFGQTAQISTLCPTELLGLFLCHHTFLQLTQPDDIVFDNSRNSCASCLAFPWVSFWFTPAIADSLLLFQKKDFSTKEWSNNVLGLKFSSYLELGRSKFLLLSFKLNAISYNDYSYTTSL